ncbi:MAG: hypothetical protein VX460_02510 [Planctomycetota bacterium]|nr:hypothetical protein [Planctomycetota bacterium]
MSTQLHLAPALLTSADAEVVMDSTTDRCALLGADGRIVRTNLAWDRDGRSGDPLALQSARVGSDYVAACAAAAAAGNRRAGAMHAQLRRLLRGEIDSISMDFERPARGGGVQRTTATLERTVDGDPTRGAVLVSFASQSDAVSRPTAVPEAGFVIPAGTTLGRLVPALNSIPAHAAILDERGRIVAVNTAWSGFSAANGGDASHTGAGVDYLAVCERAHDSGDARAADFAEGLRSVLLRARHTHVSDARAAHGGVARRFRGRATALDLAEGRYVLVTHTEMASAEPAHAARQAA